MPNLLKRLQLEGLSSGSNIASSIIEELVAEGAIRGVLRGGGSSWTPSIYAKSQQDAVRRFYEQNTYIGYGHQQPCTAKCSSRHGDMQPALPRVGAASWRSSSCVKHQQDTIACFCEQHKYI